MPEKTLAGSSFFWLNHKLFVFLLKPRLPLSLCVFLASENQQSKRLFEQGTQIEDGETHNHFFSAKPTTIFFFLEFLASSFGSYDIVSKRLKESLGMVNIQTTDLQVLPEMNVTY